MQHKYLQKIIIIVVLPLLNVCIKNSNVINSVFNIKNCTDDTRSDFFFLFSVLILKLGFV